MKFQFRRDSAANWATADPVLAAGEPGYAVDTGALKLGDGSTVWSALAAINTPPVAGATTLFVASAQAPDFVKARADVVCDGVNDADLINGAIAHADNLIPGGTTADKQGSVTLSDGMFRLNKPILLPSKGFTLQGQGFGTILMKAAGSFTDAGKGSEPALIKVASTDAGEAAQYMVIRDLFLVGRHFADWGTGTASGSPVSGIWLEFLGEQFGTGRNNREEFGFPIPMQDSDNHSYLHNLRVCDVDHGIHWESTAGGRGLTVSETMVHFTQAGNACFDINASDAKVFACTAGSTTGAASYGFRVRGGNCLMLHNKASYIRGSGAIGFSVESSRAMMIACEAQDNWHGIKVSSGDAILTGVRVDNQADYEASGVALDLGSVTSVTATGVHVHTRSPGKYAYGLVVPSSGSGMIDAYVTPDQITTPVAKGSGKTAVTSSTDLPSGVEIRIARKNSSTLRNEVD